jgi:formylglycine-generating enzyme required for sulfatase activity
MTLVEIFWGLAINWASSYSENRFKNAFEQPYIQHLRRVLNSTINNFEEKYPQKSNKLLFYHSQTFYKACEQHRLYQTLNVKVIHATLAQDKQIAPCKETEVQVFISQILHNIQQDKALTEAFHQENYQQEIFSMSQKINLLVKAIPKQDTENGKKAIQDEITNLKKQIEDIEEDSFWYKMVAQDSIGGYHDYLHKYPNRKYTDEAIKNINKIEERRRNSERKKSKKEAEKEVEKTKLYEQDKIEEEYWLECEKKREPDSYIDNKKYKYNGKFLAKAFELQRQIRAIENSTLLVEYDKQKKREELEQKRQESIIRKQLEETEKKRLLAEPELVFVEAGCLSKEYQSEEEVEKIEKIGFLGMFSKKATQKIIKKRIQTFIVNSFYIGKHLITQLQWKTLMDNNPSYFKGDDLPVERLDWDDCQKFIKKLNKLTEKNYRLPNDREWEFAAKGGNYSKEYEFSGSNNANEVAWHIQNSNNKTQSVGTKKANELGIYDMSGNVWEWCSLYEDTNQQVYCGGSWNDSMQDCCTYHCYSYITGRTYDKGFRLILPIT